MAAQAGTPAGAALTLTKNLPVASGIGGGSADAAAALRALKRLWRLEIEDAVLAKIAAGLGSMCRSAFPRRRLSWKAAVKS